MRRTRHLVAADGDAVVGYLNLTPGRDDADAMGELVVHPDARRRGIGTALLRAAADEAGGAVPVLGARHPARGASGGRRARAGAWFGS